MAETRHEGMDPSEEDTTSTMTTPPVVTPHEPSLQAKGICLLKLIYFQ